MSVYLTLLYAELFKIQFKDQTEGILIIQPESDWQLFKLDQANLSNLSRSNDKDTFSEETVGVLEELSSFYTLSTFPD